MEDFAFTLKFITQEMYDCTKEDYDDVFFQWYHRDERITVIDNYFERDSKGHLHCHGIVSLPEKYYRKSLSYPGLHYHLDPIYNRDGWIAYMQKSQSIDYSCSYEDVNKSPSEDISTEDTQVPEEIINNFKFNENI